MCCENSSEAGGKGSEVVENRAVKHVGCECIIVKEAKMVVTRVVDPDPHKFDRLDPDSGGQNDLQI
jgi:hypothetical protein